MMGLLLADLAVLGNLLRLPSCRRTAFGMLAGLLLLALMTNWAASELVAQPRLLRSLQHSMGDDSLRAMLGFALSVCPLTATWLGLALAQRQMFEAPELQLWRSAPLPPWRPAVQVLLRSAFQALLWAAALAAPLLAHLLHRAGAPATAYALIPFALVLGTLPLLASLLAVQLLLVRYCYGTWLRIVLLLASALATVGFSTWLLLGLFGSGGPALATPAGLAGSRLTWAISMAAELLDFAARGLPTGGPLLQAGGILLATLVLFASFACLHPRAVEHYQQGQLPLWQRRGRSWPASATGVVLRKEIAQLLQQPGSLIGFLLFGFLVLALAHRQVLVAGILNNPRLPSDLAHLGAMLVLWFLAVLLVLYAHMGRIALWDGQQWSLYMSAPARPATLLRGKLQAVALFLLWPLVLVGAAGAHLYGARPAIVLLFLAIGLAGNLLALGVLATVGTLPLLMRPDDNGQIQQGGKSFLGALLLVLGFELAVAPAVFGWWWLVEQLRQQPQLGDDLANHWPWLLAGTTGYALLIGGAGILLGGYQFRRLLLPR